MFEKLLRSKAEQLITSSNIFVLFQIVQLLLEHDADINATDKYKQTPLDRCCSKGNTEIVKLLLRNPKIDLSMHKECDGDHSSISLEQ